MDKAWRLVVGFVVMGGLMIISSCEKQTDFIEEEEAPATDYLTFQFEQNEMIVYDNPIGLRCAEIQSGDTIYGIFSDTLSFFSENYMDMTWIVDSQGIQMINPNLNYVQEINGELVQLSSFGTQVNITITSQTTSLFSGAFSGELYDSTQTYVGSFTGTFHTPIEYFCE
ncbi:MAG: hypothetical protein MK066_05155 [Crocinitomicaceae bacterium]|nr:hypothetical protein [Crocinitomicaceae bacterium]